MIRARPVLKKLYDEIDKDLLTLVKQIRKRLKDDKDIVISITGEEGSGKSCLAVLLGCLIDIKFDLRDNISYIPDSKEIVREFNRLNPYQCYVIDEAIRSLYKMQFMSKLQQALVEMWATERYQNKVTILVIPRFRDLTENFRNHRVKLWIHVLERGHAIVYIKDDDAHNTDPWYIDEVSKFKKRAFRGKNPALLPLDKRINIEKKTINFLEYVQFPDFPPEIKEQYVKYKTASRIQYEKDKKKEEETSVGRLAIKLKKEKNQLLYLLYNKDKNFTIEKLAELMDVSKPTIKKTLTEQQKIVDEKKALKDKEIATTGVDKFLAEAIRLERAKSLQ